MPLPDKIKNAVTGRLWVQLWLVIALLTTGLIAALGMLLGKTSEEGVRTTLLRDHREIAIRAAQAVDLVVESPHELLVAAAHLVGISHTDPWKQETLLVELGLRYPIFSRISSVALDGVERASSLPGSPAVDFTQNEWVRRAAAGEDIRSPVKISKEGIPMMEIAVPYRHFGKPAGVLHAEVSLRGMWEIVDAIEIGKTGFAFVVASDGTVVAHKDKKWVLKNFNVAERPIIRKALAGESGSKVAAGEAGKKALRGYAPVPRLGWGLVTEQDWDEAFAFAKKMMGQARLFILIGFGVSVAASILLALLIARPINRLSATADEVARGNLDLEPATRRRDEIGNLVRHFAKMIEGLKKAKAMERITAMGMAAARIAHELRNPLVAIKTYTQLFSRRKGDAAYLERFEKTVPPEIDRLERMLEELTDFSKTRHLEETTVSLPSVVEETLVLLRERLEQQKIEVNRNIAEDDTFLVRGDPEKLKQVCINLVTNAIGAMEKGGLLSVELANVDSTVRLTVADSGPGIPPEKLAKLFEPFQSTKKGGMGLGLTICRNIVQQHQGWMDVESPPGSGAAFHVYLPRGV